MKCDSNISFRSVCVLPIKRGEYLNGLHRLVTFLECKVARYSSRYKSKVYSIFLDFYKGSSQFTRPYQYGHFIYKDKEISIRDCFKDSFIEKLSRVELLVDVDGKLYLSMFDSNDYFLIYKLSYLSHSNLEKVSGKGLGYNLGAISKLPQLKLESSNKIILDFNKCYAPGSNVFYQHSLDCTSLEYSLDKGNCWFDVPVDTGKINYFDAIFRLKYC